MMFDQWKAWDALVTINNDWVKERARLLYEGEKLKQQIHEIKNICITMRDALEIAMQIISDNDLTAQYCVRLDDARISPGFRKHMDDFIA